ncbi:STAS domain-containing protein [Microbulbifer sp. CAU 1566]|uniref:STAS domain-containing protein n=1 Tax=unclassified Microbulbifer TaxID=2619833 RepID=UPI00135A9CE7|nr:MULTISPECIES: STAS domain-containing protein [unclassified Microbulbifer]MCK7597510.1 STAS domain-containing protein [Microbulbifer sp. CAU 1566]
MVVSERFENRVTSEVSDSGEALVIRVVGNFDFNLHREFQRAYRNVAPPPKVFLVDLSATDHLDSAALGMLLLLRDYCVEMGREGFQPRVELMNANAHVSHILSVSNFDRIFSIR